MLLLVITFLEVISYYFRFMFFIHHFVIFLWTLFYFCRWCLSKYELCCRIERQELRSFYSNEGFFKFLLDICLSNVEICVII